MGDSGGTDMVVFLGHAADPRLLGDDLSNLPAAEQRREPPVAISTTHNRLVTAGSVLTAATLVGGSLLALYAGWRLVFHSGGVLDAAIAAVGLLLAGTHWGWVHVAEYVGVTIDDRQIRTADQRRADWLASIEPYPRLSVTTSVQDDASTHILRVLHRPVLTDRGTFTFVRETSAEESYDADAPAAEIAAAVETMRREARLQTDRMREQWEAAASAYDAAMLNSHDDQERLAAERAAATALSEHINASLREPPLVE
jgi:hypothetical protein